ncbi:MAG: hypothetical protein EBY28_24720 [Betaproteobacteria bacterium]|nr:hypothetical protein [Betaproteobacteria bacterium]
MLALALPALTRRQLELAWRVLISLGWLEDIAAAQRHLLAQQVIRLLILVAHQQAQKHLLAQQVIRLLILVAHQQAQQPMHAHKVTALPTLMLHRQTLVWVALEVSAAT